ncbi:SphA family protein [Rhizobium sp. A37_96]
MKRPFVSSEGNSSQAARGKMRRIFTHSVVLSALAVTLSVAPQQAEAAESGTGVYLLGMKGPGSAITPPEGFYYQNDLYFYNGSLGGGRAFPTGGQLVGNIDGKAVVNLSTFLWSTPWEIGGGSLNFSAVVPVGRKGVDAGVTFSGPRLGSIGGARSDATTTIGDPTFGSSLGWSAGNFHWQVGTSVNVPVGDYHPGALANLAFHRWGVDVGTSGTWFDPSTGLDISGTVGLTFNGKNPDTDYRTGTEFHGEWSVSQYLNKQFSLGLIGYYYQQISGDSGEGAALGDFKGRVASIGATAAYNFKINETPVTARLKFFHEFAAENRAEGNSVFLTMTVPLYVAAKD